MDFEPNEHAADGVTADQARHNSSNVGGVTAGHVGHNSSSSNNNISSNNNSNTNKTIVAFLMMVAHIIQHSATVRAYTNIMHDVFSACGC